MFSIFGIGIRNIFKMNWRGPPKGPKSKSKSFIVHNNTHVHWAATQDTHTHTRMPKRLPVKFVLCF